jgi:hypothetical protein
MITPRSALSLAAAVVLALVMFPPAPPVSAQEDATPFGSISCSSNFGNSAELDKKYFHLAFATPAEIASLQKSKPAPSAAGSKFPSTEWMFTWLKKISARKTLKSQL